MMTNTLLEERLAAVEAAITQLQQQLQEQVSTIQPTDWLQQITGSLKTNLLLKRFSHTPELFVMAMSHFLRPAKSHEVPARYRPSQYSSTYAWAVYDKLSIRIADIRYPILPYLR